MTAAKKSTEGERGMNTAELKAFIEMKTTLDLSLKNTEQALKALLQGQSDTNARLDRIDSRWEERMRVVEASAIECKTDMENIKDDVRSLSTRSNIVDTIVGIATLLVGYFGIRN